MYTLKHIFGDINKHYLEIGYVLVSNECNEEYVLESTNCKVKTITVK